MTSLIETLPLLVLERICEYLDDQSRTRNSLRAFSWASRSCYAATAAQRLSQIELKVRDPEELEGSLSRWNELLTDGRNCHVVRLKISWVLTAGERKASLVREDEELDDPTAGWNFRPYFHMHNFCRPSKVSILGSSGGTLKEHPKDWEPLGQFIRQFSGLRDLIWAAGWYIPPSVLAAVSEQACRLHHHNFELPSLIQDRDNPQPVSAADYSLCTSPSLFSIVAHVGSFESGGLLNYNQEALLSIVSGLAPNLTHMCEIPKGAHGELEITRAIMLGKPDWKGFFLGEAEAEARAEAGPLSMRGGLQSLILATYVPGGYWARLIDITKLRCLVIEWNYGGTALAEIASRGELISLQKLKLSDIGDESEQSQKALNILLSSLNPLQRLEICGYVSPQTFNIIVHRHGVGLRFLSIRPYRDIRDDSRNTLVDFSSPVMQQFAEHCPHLTHLTMPINRTRGDKHEVGIYRALSKFPRLEHLHLRLMYSIGPDEEFWDEDRDGEYPLHATMAAEEIPFVYLREAFTNIAMDDTLALSIFNLISSGGHLKHLKLTLDRKVGFQAPESFGSSTLQDALRWFGRPWFCTRDGTDEVIVTPLDEKQTASCGEEWVFLLVEDIKKQRWGEEIYRQLFLDIWPQKTADWQNDWESLPLSLEHGI